MHHRTPGEVQHPTAHQPAAAPDPVRDRGVHEQGPQDNECDVGSEPHPLDDIAGNEGSSDDREGALVSHEKDVRYSALRLGSDPVQPEVVKPAEQRPTFGECQTIGGHSPGDADYPQRHEAHHHRVE